MPGQAALDEVYQHEAETLQVISATLLNADVGVQTRVTSGACEALAVFVGDVLPCFCVAVALCEAEIDCVNVMLPLAETHDKVVWFDISMEIQPGVNVFDSLYQLIC